MAAKRIKYENMTKEQKKRAQKWADKWNQKPEDCLMLAIGKDGIIITDPDDLSDVDREAYNIVQRGSDSGYVDDIDDVTEAVREKYRADMAQVKADNLPKVRLR